MLKYSKAFSLQETYDTIQFHEEGVCNICRQEGIQ